jgi:ribosomal protein L40E
MTVPIPLRCLFCNQVNPAEAIFCTGCDAQLDLQPCSHCDAVDSRSAVNCYKCGAPFVATLNTEEDSGLTVAGAEVGPAGQIEKLAHDRDTVPSVTRPRWLILAATTLLGLAVATFVLLGSEPNRRPPTSQQIVAFQPVAAATPALASPVDANPASKAVPSEIIAGATAVEKLNPVALSAKAPLAAARSTAAAARTGVGLRPVQSALKVCAEAVATLGLCSPEIKKEDL